MPIKPFAFKPATIRRIAVVSCLSCLPLAQAAPILYTRVVSTDVPVPVPDVGPCPSCWIHFERFSPPALDQGLVTYYGYRGGSTDGIFTNHDGFKIIAQSGTPAPGVDEPFEMFSDVFDYSMPSIHNGQVAFKGMGLGWSFTGIYLWTDGAIEVIADTNTQVPGSTENFFRLERPVVNSGNVVFVGRIHETCDFLPGGYPWCPGIYLRSDSLRNIVDFQTPLPDGNGNFEIMAPMFSFGQESILFRNWFDSVWQSSEGNLSMLIDVNPPGSICPSIGALSAMGNNAAYIEFCSSRVMRITNPPSVVADLNTAVPSGSGNFTKFHEILPFDGQPRRMRVACDETQTVFRAFGADGQEGIYSNREGALRRIIDKTVELDGKSIKTFDMGYQAVSGNQAAFLVEFTDDSQGIYIATSCDAGDFNGDGLVDVADIPTLVETLLASQPSNSGDACVADVNGDNRADALDVQPFVDLLIP